MKYKILFNFVLTLILLSVFITKGFSGEVQKPLEWPDYITKGTLDNGLSYIVMKHEKPKNRIFAYLLVKAGSIQEKDNERGIAHYIEHMGFNGTKNFSSGELVKYFQTIGVSMGPNINAYTSFDRTVYTIEIPSGNDEYIDKGLTALCDYGFFMLLSPEELEKERGIILEELRLGKTLSKRLYEKEIAIILKDSLYEKRLPIGTEETIKKFKPEDFKRFYSTWYRPDLMTLIIVGDCNTAHMEKKIKDFFGQIPPPSVNKPDIIVPFKPYKEIYTGVITDPELEKTTVNITYLRDPEPTATVTDFKRDLCDSLIFEMLNKRFDKESFDPNTPLISAGGYSSNWLKSVTQVSFWASAEPGKGLPALRILMKYIEGIRYYGFSSEELNDAKISLLNILEKSKKEAETHDSKYYLNTILDCAMHDTVFLSPQEKYDIAKNLFQNHSITNKDIKDRLNYLLEPANMSVIIESPEKDVGDLTDVKILAAVRNVMSVGGIDYKLDKLDYRYDYTKLKPGKVISRKTYKDINVTRLKLSNGLTVLLKPTDFDKDTVKIHYVSLGGKLLENPGTPDIFDVAKMSWDNGGTLDLSQFDVERLFKRKIQLSVGGELLYGLRGTSGPDDMEKLCQWMWQYLERPGYRKEGVGCAIKMSQQLIRTLLQTQEGVMGIVEKSILLPYNPLSVNASEEELGKYKNVETLKTFQKLSCAPCNSELIIVGAFDLNKGISLACKYFGSIPAGKKPYIPSTYLKTEFPQGKTKRIIYKGLDTRCKVNVLFPGCMRNNKDAFALDIIAGILKMRFRDVIREEKSLVYSIGTGNISPSDIKGYGRFKIVFGTDPEKIDEVIDCIHSIIKDLKSKGPTDKELSSAKKIIIFEYDKNLETNMFWMNRLEGSSLFSQDLQKIFKDKEEIESVTAQDVKSVADKYLKPYNNIILIALPEADAK